MKIRDLQAGIGAVFAAVGWFFGGDSGILLALAALAVADYVSGVAAAAVRGEVSSQVGFSGIVRKIVMFMLVGAANILDVYLLGGQSAMRSAVVFFYISNEGISLLENAVAIGLPVPDVLLKCLMLNA